MSLQIGDKVIVIESTHDLDYPPGTVLIIKHFYTSDSGYKCFTPKGKTMGCVLDDVVSEELYNSPLMKALR